MPIPINFLSTSLSPIAVGGNYGSAWNEARAEMLRWIGASTFGSLYYYVVIFIPLNN